jgi:hypothetical protein
MTSTSTPTTDVAAEQADDRAQMLQDFMEQHHGRCLRASEWDAIVRFLDEKPSRAANRLAPRQPSLDSKEAVERALLGDIADMMTEFVDNWPNPKKVSTALALIAKTMRAALERAESGPLVTCPRAERLHAPLRYCPDCPEGAACELPKDYDNG